MIHIITTVGTSIFTNYKHEDVKFELGKKKIDFSIEDAYKELLKEKADTILEDKIYEKLTKNFLSGFSKRKIIKKDEWNDAETFEFKWEPAENNKPNFDCCAEIKTVNEISKLEKYEKEKFKIHLICTETVLSKVAGRIIEKFYKKDDKFIIELHEPITGLQVHKPDDFKDKGINELIKKIKEIKNGNEDVILNISGGYKALIPILTIIGQLENIPLKYIYEDSEELIEISELPLQFNYQIIEDNLKTLKSISQKEIELNSFKYKLSKDKKQQEKLLKKLSSLLEIKSGKVKLSFLGDYILEKYSKFPDEDVRKSLYGAFIELQLFKYFVKKYGSDLIHSKKDEYEFDLYAKNNNKIFAVEVKSGGNVPLWEKKEGNKSLEYRIKKGAFNKIINENNNSQIEILIILYRAEELHPSLIKQIKDLIKQNPEKTKNIKWLWLKSDGFENSNWSVDNRLFDIISNIKYSS